jgi:hypothetical protein
MTAFERQDFKRHSASSGIPSNREGRQHAARAVRRRRPMRTDARTHVCESGRPESANARLAVMAACVGGGEGGIRTRDALPRTAFPVRRHSPLGDLSGRERVPARPGGPGVGCRPLSSGDRSTSSPALDRIQVSAQGSPTKSDERKEPTGGLRSARRDECWRRGRDSNPRCFRTPLFESGTINHSDTSPRGRIPKACSCPSGPIVRPRTSSSGLWRLLNATGDRRCRGVVRGHLAHQRPNGTDEREGPVAGRWDLLRKLG